MVTEFLERNPEFARAPATGGVPAALLTADGDFQSLPQRDGVDGAFAARLVRARCCGFAATCRRCTSGSSPGSMRPGRGVGDWRSSGRFSPAI